jgi:hypothetical protein
MQSITLGEPSYAGVYTLPSLAATYGETQMLCAGSTFEEQPAAAFCSGTLIGPDRVLTAGHCITSASDCHFARIVFDYYYQADGEMHTITENSVYKCVDYIREYASEALSPDYCIIKLDRDVDSSRVPVEISSSYTDVSTSNLYDIIGFPAGLPAKILSDFAVMDIDSSYGYFQGNPDTFGGNSGSGVFDSDGVVVGVLTSGATDYVLSGTCYIVNECSSAGSSISCGGETMTFAYVAKAGLDARACSTDVNCSSGQTCVNGYCWTITDSAQGIVLSSMLMVLTAFGWLQMLTFFQLLNEALFI